MQRTAVMGGWRLLPSSEILHLFGQGNLTFTREKSGNQVLSPHVIIFFRQSEAEKI